MAKRAGLKTSQAGAKTRGAKARPKKARGSVTSGVVVAPKRSEPAGPAAKAVAALEAGMQAMQRADYAGATTKFEALIAEFPHERALLDWSRVYLEKCQRALQKTESAPETLEERITAATAALNNDDDGRAESLAKGVLAEEPGHDLALYLLASIDARRGRLESALAYLGQAIGVSPEAAAQARLDRDFEVLRETEQFRQLTNLRR